MTPAHYSTVHLLSFRDTSAFALCRQLGTACGLAIALLLPTSLQAEQATVAPSSAKLALHQQPETPAEIRLKIHGIEHLRPDLEEAVPESGTDELKKQAQTQYLAAKFKKQEKTVRQYVDLAWAEAGKREKLAPELLIAIMQKESAFRPKVQSRYGAQGLMQVVRRWHHDKLQPSESLFDPVVNVRVGADVLEEYLKLAGGNMDRALRRYSGNARGYADTVLKESRRLARLAEQAASKTSTAQG